MKRILSFVLASVMLLTTFVGSFSLAAFADEEAVEFDLTTYPRKSTEVGWGNLGINKGLDGGKVDIKNPEGKLVTYDKALVAHAASKLTYDISGKMVTRFTAIGGVERSTNNSFLSSATIGFKVWADGKLLYDSRVVTDKSGSIEIDVTIPGGAKTLVLETTAANDGNTGDHSAWATPMLYSDPSIRDEFSGMTFTLPEKVMLEGETMQSVLEAVTNGGDPITPDSVTYTSDNESVVSVSSDGLLTGKGEGTAKVTCTLVFKGESYSESANITVIGKDSTAKTWSLPSPGGELKIVFARDKYGRLSYKVANGESVVLPNGTVGVQTDLCDFTLGLKYVGESKVTEKKETYKAISGKRSEVLDHYKEQTLTFEKDGYYFDVILRAYDDGFAYRFAIRAENGNRVAMVVHEETSAYTLEAGAKVYCAIVTAGELDVRFNYETSYTEHKIEKLENRYVAYPILYTTDNKNYVLLSESELYMDSYAGSMTQGIGNNTLKMHWAPVVHEVVINTDFTSPWRFGIAGDLGTIVESDMTEKLCERTDEDYSWVEPGVTAWMWLSEGYDGQSNFKRILEYVDLASEFGWKYLILDEGWQPRSTSSGKAYEGYYSWFPGLVQYAESKGVGLIAWVKYIDLNTTERLDLLDEFASVGIKGIKADFFDNEDQATMDQMKAIYERCAKLKLVVNCHGANKPTGERVYWPNILNREAVNGEEYGGYDSYNLTVWPFTRGVLGPMDLTPRLNTTGSVTNGAQLAMNIVFECGIPCMASSVEEYRESVAKPLLMNLPAAWDDTKFIDGVVGKYTILARRSGENWYVGAVSKGNNKNLNLPLDFLDEDVTYTAYIFRDGSGRTNLKMDTQKVTAKDILTFGMLDGGGYTAMFVPVQEQKPIEKPNDIQKPEDDKKDEPKENVGGPSSVIFVIAAIAAVAVGGVTGFVFARKKKDDKED